MWSVFSSNMNMFRMHTGLWGSMDVENKENAEEPGRSTAELKVHGELSSYFV
jgi:hypothetical protein